MHYTKLSRDFSFFFFCLCTETDFFFIIPFSHAFEVPLCLSKAFPCGRWSFELDLLCFCDICLSIMGCPYWKLEIEVFSF